MGSLSPTHIPTKLKHFEKFELLAPQVVVYFSKCAGNAGSSSLPKSTCVLLGIFGFFREFLSWRRS